MVDIKCLLSWINQFVGGGGKKPDGIYASEEIIAVSLDQESGISEGAKVNNIHEIHVDVTDELLGNP